MPDSSLRLQAANAAFAEASPPRAGREVPASLAFAASGEHVQVPPAPLAAGRITAVSPAAPPAREPALASLGTLAPQVEPEPPEGSPRAAEPRALARAGRQAPVRWHAEWQGDELHVWLGLDREPAKASEAVVQQVVRELQGWIAARGGRLGAIVCNGRTVWRRGSGGTPGARDEAPHSEEST